MSVLGGNPLLLGSGDAAGFTTERSVRLRSSNSAYFNRTLTTPTNNIIWTWSAWVKRGTFGAAQQLIGTGTLGTGADQAGIQFLADNSLTLYQTQTGTGTFEIQVATTQVLRDPSAWYHIVVAYDSAQGTAANRVKIYINGVQVTAFTTATYPTSSLASRINAARSHDIGRYGSGVNYFDGYLTEVNFIDGQALTPTSFGEYDAVRNTQWKPKRYTGTYGTNGFYLNFSDNSNNTAATIGKDSSGNSNNWTPTGISVTAGVTYDSMTDVPTLTGDTAANYCTLNPLNSFNNTLSNGNLTTVTPLSLAGSAIGTIQIPDTGKWYWEFYPSTNGGQSYSGLQGTTTSLFYYGFNGNKYLNGAATAYGATYTGGDTIGVAVDSDAGTVTFYKNNASQGSITFTIAGASLFPAFQDANTGVQVTIHTNFGQQPFTNTPPTGFKRLNTYNLPDPAVASSDDYHKIYSYTGNGGGLQVGEIQKPASLFNLDRSIRLRSSASARFTRTPATAGNRKTWTWSAWVKRGALASDYGLFNNDGATNTDYFYIKFDASDRLYVGNFSTNFVTTTAIYRDPSLFYHLVVTLDTTQATATDRLKVYVNGVQVTSFNTDNRAAQIALNSDQGINRVATHIVGNTGAVHYFDGYIADMYLIDGQALDATSFGAYDGNFYWTPKAYTGTYGTNGFHLEFEDNSAATAAAIGKDTSGNGNNWTPSGISVTAGNTYDSMTDVPTQTSTTVANFAVINPLTTIAFPVTNGNLSIGASTTANRCSKSSIAVSSGKWYWELRASAMSASGQIVGVCSADAIFNGGTVSTGFEVGYYSINGNKYINGTASAYGSSWGTPQTIGVALDIDGGTVTFYRDNVSQGAIPIQGGQTWVANWTGQNTGDSVNFTFGQRPFDFTPPAGFKVLNSFNIAEVLGDVETPDFVWIKSRSASGDHALFNSVVGTGKYFRSSSASAEVTDVNSLIQFNKNGFLLGNSSIVNASATTFVASVWKAGNTTVTNTAGSISSQVRASTTSGISIVTWTGTGSNNPTIGHGLGKVPALIIAKNRDTSATDNNAWVYHQNIGTNYYILLTSPNLRATGALNGYIGTSPSDQTFTITAGSTSSNNLNEINDRFEAICFSEIDGFSKFGSYLSNNDTNGPFVYTGFRPRWLMVKRAIAASGTGGWFMYDAERNTYNVMDKYIFAEGTAGDNTLAVFDFTSNGFKIRSNNVHVNTTVGDTYIYMAFAENPFKYALAR